MNKKEFKRIGIDEEYLSERIGTRVRSFFIEEIKKGPRLRSELYRFQITPAEGAEFTIFVKDAREGLNNSGDIPREGELERNELSFLMFGKDNSVVSVPGYLGHKSYKDSDDKEHTVIVMSDEGRSLEDFCYDEMPPDTRQFNLVQRTYDKAIVNGHVAVIGGYRTESVIETPIIYRVDEKFINEIINKALMGLLTYRYGVNIEAKEESKKKIRLMKVIPAKQFKEFLSWDRKHGFGIILDNLKSATIPELTKGACKILLPLGFQPDDVLMGNERVPDSYESADILRLLKGERVIEREDSIKITDNCRIGEGPLAMLAFLSSHLAFNFSSKQMQELGDHVLLQYTRVIEGRELGLQDIGRDVRTAFDNEWKAAQLLAWLYRLDFITNLNNNHPERAREIAEQRPLYVPKTFINGCIERIIELEMPHFERVHTGLGSFKVNGSTLTMCPPEF